MSAGDQWAWGHNEESGFGLHTEHRNQVKAACAPDNQCCDKITPEDYPQLQILVLLREAVQPIGDVTRNCELFVLDRDAEPQPDGRICYRGDIDPANWLNCIDPNVAEIVWCCSNVNQAPDEDDCTTAFELTWETGQSVLINAIRDDSCCCDPPCSVWRIPIGQLVDLNAIPDSAGGSCGVINPDETELLIYVYGPDPDDGMVSCLPIPWPTNQCLSEPPNKGCGELVPVTLEFTQARVEVRTRTFVIPDNPITLEFEPATVEVQTGVMNVIAGSDNCCAQSGTMNCIAWIEYEPPIGEIQCIEIGFFALAEEPGGTDTFRAWSGNATGFEGCISPANFPVRLICTGSGDLCNNLITVTLNNIPVARFSCSCTGGIAFASQQDALSDFNLTIDNPNNCLLPIDAASIAAIGLYIRSGTAESTRPPNACIEEN